MRKHLGLGVASFVLIAGIAACSGGNSSSAPPMTPPIAVITASPATSAPTATPAPASTSIAVGTTGATTQLSTSTGITTTIAIPAPAGGSAGSVAVAISASPPAGLPTPSSVARVAKGLGSGASPVFYVVLTPATSFTLASYPSFTFGIPGTPPTGMAYFTALFDPTNAALGYTPIEGPGTVAGTTVTLSGGTASLTVTGGLTYVFVVYASPASASGATATPASSASPSPAPTTSSGTPGASPTPTIAPATATPASATATPTASPSPQPTLPVVTPTPVALATPTPTPAPIVLSSSTVSILPPMSTTLTISEANYSGTFSVNAASCFNVALVNQTAPNTIVIVSLAAGTCAFTVSDQQNQSTMATIGTLSKSLTGVLTEFPAGPGSGPFSIVTGPDGNLWFTEPAVDKIGTMTPNGTLIAEFPTSAGAGLRTIRVGPDGNLWFTERTLSRIGRITTKGGLTEFPLAGGSNPSGITAGPDGGIWFSEGGTNNMARMSTTGILNGELSVGANSGIAGVAVGPDGNIWYAAMGSPGLRPSENGRLTTSGTLTKFPLAAGTRGNIAIAPASDGNLWFTEYCGNRIGVMTTNGSPTEYAINGSVPATNCLAPTVADRLPNGIVQGPDGNIWFAESNTNKIGVASRSGSILGEIGTTGTSGPTHITLGPDGAIWFTEQSTNKIGRIQ